MEKTISKYETQVRSFLRKEWIMNLSTVDHKHRPHVTPVIYIIDSKLNFYFISRQKTKKIKNITNSNYVSAVVWSKGIMSVQVEGVAKEIKNLKEAENIFERIANRATEDDSFWPPVLQWRQGGNYVVYTIIPKKVSYLLFSNSHISEKNMPVYTIKI